MNAILSALFGVISKLYNLWQKVPEDIRKRAIDAAAAELQGYFGKRFDDAKLGKRKAQ